MIALRIAIQTNQLYRNEVNIYSFVHFVFYQLFNIITRLGYVMSAAEIQPLYPVEHESEFLLHMWESTLQGIRALLAHRVEVKSVNALVQRGILPEFLQRAAEPGAGEAGVINVRFDLAVLRIHAYPCLYVVRIRTHPVPELRPLPW